MTLNRIRYQQQYQQARARIAPSLGTVATYDRRDATTGQRIVKSADGSEFTTQYLSNSVPNDTLTLARFNPIGLPGYISQKPY